MKKRPYLIVECENNAVKKLKSNCDSCMLDRSIREMYVFSENDEVIAYATMDDDSIALHITENVSLDFLKKFLDEMGCNTKFVVFSTKDQKALKDSGVHNIELRNLPQSRKFRLNDIAPAWNCKNPLSYGEICVHCGKCGRTRADW